MIAASDRPPWQNPRVISTLMLVFLAGAASGALSMQFGLHNWLHRVVAAPNPVVNRDILPLQKLNAELGLSPDQSLKISAVLADYTQYYQSLQDQLDDIRATGKTRIMQILNPDQRARFQKLMGGMEDPQPSAPASK